MLYILAFSVIILSVFPADVVLPALPIIADEFSHSLSISAAAVTGYLIVFGISTMFIGYVSDVVGRRVTMTVGLMVSIIGSLICVFSVDSFSFLSGRMIEAAGASCFGLVHAIIRDRMTGHNANRIRIFITALSGFLISTAPLFGSIVIELMNWRALFAIFSMAAVITLIFSEVYFKKAAHVEDKDKDKDKDKGEEGVAVSYPLFWTNSIIGLLVFVIHFSFIILSVYGLMIHFSLSNLEYGYTMLAYGIAFVVSGVVQTRFTNKLKLSNQKIIGLIFIGAGVSFMAAVPYADSVSLFMVGVSVCAIGVSFLQPAVVTSSLDSVPSSKGGLYTSYILLVRFGMGGVASSILLLDMEWSFVNLGEIYLVIFVLIIAFLAISNRLEGRSVAYA